MDPINTVNTYLNQDTKISENAQITKLFKECPCMVNENKDQVQVLHMSQSMIDKNDNSNQILEIHNNTLECSIANASNLTPQDVTPVKLEYKRQYDHIYNKFMTKFEERNQCVYDNGQYMHQLKSQRELQTGRKTNFLEEITLVIERIDNINDRDVIAAQDKLEQAIKAIEKQQVILENLANEVGTVTNKIHAIRDDASIENKRLREFLKNLDAVSYAEVEETTARLQKKVDELEEKNAKFCQQLRCDDETNGKEYEVLKVQVENDELDLLQQGVDICKRFNCPYELNNSIDTFIRISGQMQAFAIDAHHGKLAKEEHVKQQLCTLNAEIDSQHHITESEETKLNDDIIQCKVQLNKYKEFEQLLPGIEAQYNSNKVLLTTLDAQLNELSEASILAFDQGLADEQEIKMKDTLEEERKNQWKTIIKKKKSIAIAELETMNTKIEKLEKLVQHADISRQKMFEKFSRIVARNKSLENIKKVTFNEVVTEKNITADTSDMTQNTSSR